MSKRSSWRINPSTGKLEEQEVKQAPEPSAGLIADELPKLPAKALNEIVSRESFNFPTFRREHSESWDDGIEGSAFKVDLDNLLKRSSHDSNLPEFVWESRDTVRSAKTLDEFYRLYLDAYKLLDTGYLDKWMGTIFGSVVDMPKIYADKGSHGSRVPLPVWGGPADVEISKGVTLKCYSIATTHGYFGALSWDNENVMVLTALPDSRDAYIQNRRSDSRGPDHVVLMPWRSVDDMIIGHRTESMITYDWAGSEARYESCQDYLGRPRDLVDRGYFAEPMRWEARKWDVINTNNYQYPGDRYPLRHYGTFDVKASAEIVAKEIGGEVDPHIWWASCKKCYHKTEPFWVGIPECPKCGDVMINYAGTRYTYDGKSQEYTKGQLD